MTLFIHCYSKGHDALQETALRILSDILTTHHTILLPVATVADGTSVAPPTFQKPLLRSFAKALKTSSPPAVQTVAVTALAKMLLTGTLSPSGPAVPPSIKELNDSSIDALLMSLIVSFFHPRTRDNLALRQALTYFLPVFCHSRVSNAQHMRKIAVPAVHAVLAAADDYFALEAEEDSDGEIDDSMSEKEVKALISGLTGMLAEWTDERRIVGLGVDPNQPPGMTATTVNIKPADSLHLAITRDILQRTLGAGTSSAAPREERKYLLSFLAKLHIPSPPAAPVSRAASRGGSRAPDGPGDDRASMRSSTPMSTAPHHEATDVSSDGGAELLLQVKDLLDQAIAANVAADAAGRNALVKAKNSVLKLLAAAQLESHFGQKMVATGRGGSVGPSGSGSASAPTGGKRERDRDASQMPNIKEEDEEEAAAAAVDEGYSRASVSTRRDEGHSRASAAPSVSAAPSMRRSSKRSASVLSTQNQDEDGGDDNTIVARPRISANTSASRRDSIASAASRASRTSSRRSNVSAAARDDEEGDGNDTPRASVSASRRESLASAASSRASRASSRRSNVSAAAQDVEEGDGGYTPRASVSASRRESVASAASSRASRASSRLSNVSVASSAAQNDEEGDGTIVARPRPRASVSASRRESGAGVPSSRTTRMSTRRSASIASSSVADNDEEEDDTIVARPRTTTTRRESGASVASRMSRMSTRRSVSSSVAGSEAGSSFVEE